MLGELYLLLGVLVMALAWMAREGGPRPATRVPAEVIFFFGLIMTVIGVLALFFGLTP